MLNSLNSPLLHNNTHTANTSTHTRLHFYTRFHNFHPLTHSPTCMNIYINMKSRLNLTFSMQLHHLAKPCFCKNGYSTCSNNSTMLTSILHIERKPKGNNFPRLIWRGWFRPAPSRTLTLFFFVFSHPLLS